MADLDQIRFVMHSPQLNNPISLPFMPLKELTPRRIMFEVERVLQSHEEFTLSNDLHINLIHVQIPSGSGNGKRRSGRMKPFCGVNLQTRHLSVPAFLGRVYFCQKFEKGYNPRLASPRLRKHMQMLPSHRMSQSSRGWFVDPMRSVSPQFSRVLNALRIIDAWV